METVSNSHHYFFNLPYKARIGIDIIRISRIKKAVDRSGKTFLRKVYTDRELELGTDVEHLAMRFAGKEAVFKALRITWEGDMGMKDIEILRGEYGEPVVILHGKIKEIASRLKVADIALSLSYDLDYAVACAIVLYTHNTEQDLV